jgi:hypothetical protein
MTRSLRADIDRLNAQTRQRPPLTDQEVAARYDEGVDPLDIHAWLYRQEWRRAHRARLAGMAQTIASFMPEGGTYKPTTMERAEIAALTIAATPLDQQPCPEAVRMITDGSILPTGTTGWMAKGNMRKFRMHQYFTYCVLRIQLGGVDGIGIRRDIDAGRYKDSRVGVLPSLIHGHDWTVEELEFPGPNGKGYWGPLWQGWESVPNGADGSPPGSHFEMVPRFTPEQAANWPQ